MFFTFSLFLIVCMWYSSWFFMVVGEALGEEKTASVTIPHSTSERWNLPELVWQNNCISQFPITSCASPATIGDQEVQKVKEPASVNTCHRPEKRWTVQYSLWITNELQKPSKLQRRVKKSSKVQHNISHLSLLIQNTSRQTWWDGTLNAWKKFVHEFSAESQVWIRKIL